jgi:cytochrome bd ubiquinol oxidase subunit II
LQAWSRRAGRICLVGVAVAVVAVSVWTPLVDPGIAQRWFSWPNILWLSPVPVVTAAITALCWLSLGGRSEAPTRIACLAVTAAPKGSTGPCCDNNATGLHFRLSLV